MRNSTPTNLAFPTSSSMPDLSGLSNQVMLTSILNSTLGPSSLSAIADYEIRMLSVHYTRLVDHALLEYECARVALNEVIDRKGRFGPLVRAMCHMETCITTTYRSARFAHGLTAQPSLRPQLRSHLDKLDVLRASRRGGSLKGVRDAIHHMDERIIKGHASEGSNLCLHNHELTIYDYPIKEGVTEGITHTIKYIELAKWLKQLHKTSMVLATKGLQLAQPDLYA